MQAETVYLFRHALMRGLKHGQPWMLLEQTPSQVQWRPVNPLKRPGYPEEVASTALFLATEASSYSTGLILQVDGGVLA